MFNGLRFKTNPVLESSNGKDPYTNIHSNGATIDRNGLKIKKYVVNDDPRVSTTIHRSPSLTKT